MKKRQRFRIRVQEIYEDYIWIEAETWKEAEKLASTSKRDLAQCEFLGTLLTEWSGDTEEIK